MTESHVQISANQPGGVQGVGGASRKPPASEMKIRALLQEVERARRTHHWRLGISASHRLTRIRGLAKDYYTLAWFEWQRENYRDAMRALDAALERQPNYSLVNKLKPKITQSIELKELNRLPARQARNLSRQLVDCIGSRDWDRGVGLARALIKGRDKPDDRLWLAFCEARRQRLGDALRESERILQSRTRNDATHERTKRLIQALLSPALRGVPRKNRQDAVMRLTRRLPHVREVALAYIRQIGQPPPPPQGGDRHDGARASAAPPSHKTESRKEAITIKKPDHRTASGRPHGVVTGVQLHEPTDRVIHMVRVEIDRYTGDEEYVCFNRSGQEISRSLLLPKLD